MHVAAMEAGLLELRSAPADIELQNSIFRSAHSIKGVAEALKTDAHIVKLSSGGIAESEAERYDTDQQDSQRELEQPAEDSRGVKLYTVELIPSREMFASGTTPITLLRNLGDLGTVSGCQ